jgi:hypothetical protein
MRALGYKLESQTADAVVWKQSPLRNMLTIHWLAIFQGWRRVTVSLTDAPDGGTYVTIAGAGPRRLARQFDKLRLVA